MKGLAARRDLLDKATIGPDTPLRLDIAAAFAYPDGSMTASGLRREAGRGRLAIERGAGKDYTTLPAIAEMRERCRQNTKDRASGCARLGATGEAEPRTGRSGSSSTENIRRARAAAATIVLALKQPSKLTSPASGSRRRRRGHVIPIKSRSPMSSPSTGPRSRAGTRVPEKPHSA